MQEYSYTARNETGKVVRGVINAENDTDLATKVSAMGYYLTQFQAVSRVSFLSGAGKEIQGRLNAKTLLHFTYQCAILLDAGIPLLEALSELARTEKNETTQKIFNDIRIHIEQGGSFKSAIQAHPASFSPLYISVVGAGEATGKMAQSMDDLVTLLEWQMDMRNKVREIATYPIIVISVMSVVVTILVVKVIPAFEPIFQHASEGLPWPTQLILSVSHLVRNFWFVIIGAIGLLFAGYKAFVSTKEGRYQIDRLKLNLPGLGIIIRKLVLTRFTHTFSVCFKAGINILSVLDLAGNACGNTCLAKAIEDAKEAVKNGEKLANSLQATGEFPSIVIHMVHVGEQAAAMTEMMEKVSNYYDKEVNNTIRQISTLIEPALIVILGSIVGIIALAIFLPLFRMAELIG